MVEGLSPVSVSIIVPTWNGAGRIEHCLAALSSQNFDRPFEIIVVNDGSTDNTLEVLAQYPRVRVISQPNAGPAAARNRGVREALGDIVAFTDDDCQPLPDWLTEMSKPFADPEVVGAKGIYRTRQTGIIPRFVQIDYEDRYRRMRRLSRIDFVDTYSAAFRRNRFLEMDGYDVTFPVACSEDVELSYRMSARGWKMVFVPTAIVYHTHPRDFASYLKKKYKFAFWRVLAVKKNPSKAIRDSHTPQLMKLQMLFGPALAAGLAADLLRLSPVPLSALVALVFLLSALPFSIRAFRKSALVGTLSPFILAARSGAQLLGVILGALHAFLGSATDLLDVAGKSSAESDHIP
jgi:glycosyltransferase involved in cell wall biosynthesis